MAHSFSFDGVDFATFGVAVERSSYEGFDADVPLFHIPQGDKAAAFNSYLKPRRIVLNCVILRAQASAGFISERQIVIHNALSSRAAKPLALDTYNGYYINAICEGVSDVSLRPIRRFKITFICPDPFFIETFTPPSGTATVNSTTFNFIISIVAQHAHAPLVVAIFPSASLVGEITIILINTDTAQSITKVFSSGFTVITPGVQGFRFNGPIFRFQTTNDSGATWTDAMLGISGEFPEVKSGTLGFGLSTNNMILYGVPSTPANGLAWSSLRRGLFAD
jgi:hypothetical protein